MQGIPPVLDTDAEDVAWALQTADALWKRSELVDAIVWLRRAAQAAGEANDDDRALALARDAAELTEWLSKNRGEAVPPPSNAVVSSNRGTGVDELLRASVVDESELEEPTTLVREQSASVPDEGKTPLVPPVIEGALPQAAPAPLPFPDPLDAPLPSFPLDEQSSELMAAEMTRKILESVKPVAPAPGATVPAPLPPVTPPPTPAASPAEPVEPQPIVVLSEPPPPAAAGPSSEEELPIVPPPPAPEPAPAADVHAGMLNPWDDEPKSVTVDTSVTMPDKPAIPGVPRIGFDEEEVVTSAKPLRESLRVQAVSPHEAPTGQYGTVEDDAPTAKPPPVAPPPPKAPPPKAPPPPRPPPPRPPPASAPKIAAAPPKPASVPKIPAAPPLPSPPLPAPPPAPAPRASAPEPAPPSIPGKPQSIRPRSMRNPAQQILRADGTLDLSGVESLTDLPDDEREAFARAATLTTLAHEQEISGFALALVLSGEVDVAATVIDAPAVRVGVGSVLRSRGTTDEGVPIRLVCASDLARLATWDDEAVNTAFSACPWVEDELRLAADRVQALVGVTVGPLGERLDPSLRSEVTNRLEVRSLGPGEIVVHKGQAVPGMLIVGVGEIEVLRDDGAVDRAVMCGEFLFPDAILQAGPAPAAARAGRGGALVLFGSRALAQELLVTCPPLLEVFAGM
jgi:hypothetical protein